MKKTKLIIFFTMLVMSICFIIPLKVSAQTPDGYAEDWYDYITQFEDGFATATVDSIYVDYPYTFNFTILIKQSPDNDFDDYYIQYVGVGNGSSPNEHYVYFEESLADVINFWMLGPNYSFEEIFELAYEGESEYNGIIFWNFEEECWQIEPYGTSELDYYRQRVEYLEGLVSDLENEIQQLEDEIQQLEDAFEDALNEEYSRGFEAGKQSIIDKNNEAFYNGLEKWLVPAIITVIALGGFLTIAARKRREE